MKVFNCLGSKIIALILNISMILSKVLASAFKLARLFNNTVLIKLKFPIYPELFPILFEPIIPNIIAA